MAKNKNVTQPLKTKVGFPFNNSNEKNVLILGQVINDFSIIETDLANINSLQLYKEMISKILHETSYNVIFKAHPWEKSKVNLKRSLTKDELTKFISSTFSHEERLRIEILEDFNIDSLFASCDHIVGLCSQSLIEAAYSGKKPHQIGNAFFGSKGFTYDHSTVENFILSIKSDTCKTKLTLLEYDNLLCFLTLLLQYHLVSVFPSGHVKLLEKLHIKKNINIIQNTTTDYELSPSKKIDIDNESADTSVLAFLEDRMSSNHHINTNSVIEYFLLSFISEKKFKKFKSNPKKYFQDSKYPFVSFLGKFY